MKKHISYILLLIFILCNTACSAQKNSTDNDFAISTETEVPGGSNTASNKLSEPVPEDDIPLEADLLSEAIKAAIADANRGKYYPGEFYGIGYKTIETFEEDDILSIYALTEYVEYGFEDNVFVNVSGTNPKVLMRFRITADHNYELIFYTRLDLFSNLSEEELEKLVQPLKDTGNDYLYTEQDLQEVRAQADEEAAEYLKSINRTADIGVRQNHKGQRLEEIVSDDNLLTQLFKDNELNLYPDWLGTLERIENEERYVYQTAYDGEKQEITYTKMEYKTGAVIKTTVVDTQTGRITR